MRRTLAARWRGYWRRSLSNLARSRTSLAKLHVRLEAAELGRVTEIIHQRIEAGQLSRDPAQLDAAEKLDDLLVRLSKGGKGGWFSKPKAG